MITSTLNEMDGNPKRYKKIPPEGGWGFLVLLGLSFVLTCTLGTFPSLALIFAEFLSDLGEHTSAVPSLMSWYFASSSCVGLVTNYFFKMFTFRAVAMTGAMVFVLGSVWAIFARSMLELIFAFGILEGAGFGLMIAASYSTFNAYFVRKRIMMMSVAQSIYGLGTMAYPLVVEYVMKEYGYRGFMAIRASIYGHVIFFMLAMHPVKWHMKKILREDELLVEDQVNAADGPPNIQKETVSISDENKATFQIDDTAKKSVSIKTLGKKIVDFWDLTLLKDLTYVNISMGMAFALYSDMTFFAIQPTYLLKQNFDKPTIVRIVAIGSTADLASRILLAISSSWIRLTSRDIYLLGAALTIVTRFVFLYVHDLLGMIIITATMSFIRTWIHVTIPLVFAEYLPTQRFPSGYGLFMFMQGMVLFVFTAIVNKIGNVFDDDIIVFHCLTLVMSFCVIPWVAEMIWLKVKKN